MLQHFKGNKVEFKLSSIFFKAIMNYYCKYWMKALNIIDSEESSIVFKKKKI